MTEYPPWESCQVFLVAKVLTSGPVNLVLSHQTGFPNASIFLLINQWSQLSLLCYSTRVRNCNPATSSMQHATCSTKILLAKIKQVEERLCYQSGYNFAILTIRNSSLLTVVWWNQIEESYINFCQLKYNFTYLG